MHTKYYKVALAMAAGISLGAAAVEGLHAQAKRAGYVVAEIDMNDQDGYMKEFLPPAVNAIEEAGGKYGRTRPPAVLEAATCPPPAASPPPWIVEEHNDVGFIVKGRDRAGDC